MRRISPEAIEQPLSAAAVIDLTAGSDTLAVTQTGFNTISYN